MIKISKIVSKLFFFAILVLFLGGNYFVVNAEENSSEGTPQVIAQAKVNIKELPKTGLPLLGFGLASLFPGGLLFKRLTKKNEIREDSPNAVWLGRQLKD